MISISDREKQLCRRNYGFRRFDVFFSCFAESSYVYSSGFVVLIKTRRAYLRRNKDEDKKEGRKVAHSVYSVDVGYFSSSGFRQDKRPCVETNFGANLDECKDNKNICPFLFSPY